MTRRSFSGDTISSKPLVSVIITFLNEEKFIREAIDSVFAQTYNNWELLLVDDGSTDASTEIAFSYAQQYPQKVRYLQHPGHQNRGMSAARNLGISQAEGEYIAFLDADDVWLAHKLERQVQILDVHPDASVVYGKTQYWYGWTGNPEDVRYDFVPELGVPANTLFEPPMLLTLLRPLGSSFLPCPGCDLLMRRETAERTGGFEESFRGMYEDEAFMYKVYLKETVFVADECWDRYRQHPEQSMPSIIRAGQQHFSRLFFLNWLEEYLSNQEFEDAEIWKLLREERLIAQVGAHAQKREWKQVMRGLMVLLRYHPQALVCLWQRLILRLKKLFLRPIHCHPR